MAELAIDTRHLSRRFGDLLAVRDVSLSVEKGEIFGVLGPNGAGKSTVIRMLCGILDPTDGQGQVVGVDIRRDPERIKQRVGYMTQKFSLYEDLTVAENVTFAAGIYGIPWRERRQKVAAVILEAGLHERRGQLAGTLSGGWKQRVALAAATIHDPRLLFLDEPTAGVDPTSRREFWHRIHELSSKGTTVLLTTHYMDEAERCHRLAFIFRGSLLETGTPEAVVARRQLSIVELRVDRNEATAAELVRSHPRVVDVGHFGKVLRVTTRGADCAAVCREVLGSVPATITELVPVRVTVEDAFVDLVRLEGQPAQSGA